MNALADVPRLHPLCRMTVVVPARNEERVLSAALHGLAVQASSEAFDVIAFANSCNDATAAIARAFAGEHALPRLYVVEGDLPSDTAHVGFARRLLMDCAAARFLDEAGRDGIIATTDADTVVAGDFVETTFAEMQTVDAVAADVSISDREREAMPPAVRALYAQENAFRLAWAQLESLLDPSEADPWPRHRSFVAAGFAVRASAYRRAGGLPIVSALEDRQFAQALDRIDARVRHSLRVRAATSGRRSARVAGGFGTLVDHLHRCAAHSAPFLVENPREILDAIECRVAVRRILQATDTAADVAALSGAFDIDPGRVRGAIDASRGAGDNLARLKEAAGSRRPIYPMVPVEEATSALRASIAGAKDAAPTRCTTASYAG